MCSSRSSFLGSDDGLDGLCSVVVRGVKVGVEGAPCPPTETRPPIILLWLQAQEAAAYGDEVYTASMCRWRYTMAMSGGR